MGSCPCGNAGLVSAPARVREWNFENVDLGDVVAALRKATPMNFYVNWRALEAAGVAKNTPITLKATNVSLARVLDMVVDQLSTDKQKVDSVYWLVDDGILTITTGQSLNRHTLTRTYYVGDMLASVPNFVGPRLGIGKSGSDSNNDSSNTIGDLDGGASTETTTETRKEAEEKLINTIKQVIGEEFWHPQGKGALTIHRNRMIITQTKLGFLLLSRGMRRR